MTSPDVLGRLERPLGALLGAPKARTTAQLHAQAPGFEDLVATLADDLEDDRRTDPRAGVGMRSPHRQFDIAWLNSDKVEPELIAVVNRIDRQPFAPEHCGETRLLYRLAYETTLEGQTVRSRLPMTFNVVLWADAKTCQDAARAWLVPEDASASMIAATLLAGPLASEKLTRLKSVEVDLQSVRWPGTVHPSLGGHAEYILRVFHRRGDALVPGKLENTPDVASLRRDPKRRGALLEWLRAPEQRQALADGVLVLPDEYLAERGRSVTPRGFARLANRPFSQLYSPADFADLELTNLEHTPTPQAVLRRLDGLTCGGCHESRSVAGFHMLGEEPKGAVLDALASPISPHLHGDLPRREAVVAAVVRGDEPSAARPLSEHDRDPGSHGTHCGLPGQGFDAWTCDAGLTCVALDDPQMGECLPPAPRSAGAPCEVGTIRTHATAHKDRVRHAEKWPCAGDAVCNTNRVGFPQGMCTSSCEQLSDGESCGAIVALHPFNLCVGRGRPFPACVRENASPAGMRACDVEHPCRDDYVCARTPNDERGACLPPYFLFQLRVDGHVL